MRLYSQLTSNWVTIDEGCVLGAGGEGRVFGVLGGPAYAAKIYDDGGRPERDQKLRAMLANAPASPRPGTHTAIAWPQDLLSEAPDGLLAGYIMPRVRDARVIDEFYNPQARLEQCPLFHYEYLIMVARNLAAAVRSLHQRGYVVGDIKQSNILVTQSALVTLVDTDSFQVRDGASGVVHRCPVGTPEYTPPELQGLTSLPLLTPAHDLFGLGALIFQLLMEGSHPFAGAYTGDDDPPPLGERIRLGWFPHDSERQQGEDQSATFRRQQEVLTRTGPLFVPARKALPFEVLPPEIRAMFLRCFVDGAGDPCKRPSASEWQQALDQARTDLVRCSHNSQHRYGSHLVECPWCYRMTSVLRGHDPFPLRTVAVGYDYDRPGGVAAARSAAGAPQPDFQQTVPQSLHYQPAAPSISRPVGKVHSGWPAYALAALGIPVMLGLVSSHDIRRERRSPSYQVDPFATSSAAPPSSVDEVAPAPLLTPLRCSPEFPDALRASSARPSLTPDGRFAVVRSGTTTALLIETRSGRCDGQIRLSSGSSVDSMAIAASGSAIACADRHGVIIFDRSSSQLHTAQATFGTVRSMAFGPKGQKLAIGDSEGDNLVTLVDSGTGAVLRHYGGNYGEMVTAVQFSPYGTHLYAVTVGSRTDGAAFYCWDVVSGSLLWRRSELTWNTRMTSSPDGVSIAIGGAALDVRNASDGEPRRRGDDLSASISDAEPLCFSRDGRLLLVNTGNTPIVCGPTGEPGSIVATLPTTGLVSAAFSTDGSRLMTLSTSEGIEEWDARTWVRLSHVSLPDANTVN